jgi:hypothetical protein
MTLPAEFIGELGAVVKAMIARLDERKTYDQYRSRLWGAMLRLYNGGRDANFVSGFVRSIDVQLTEAWNKGAADVDIAPDEQSKEDRDVLTAIIDNETKFIERIMGEIADDRDAGMTRDDFDKKYGARVDLWANRYNETVNRAHVQLGSKVRMEWVLGATEEHCETCAALNGIVAFGVEWEQARLHPQMPPNDLLECEGWRCDCKLEVTKKRRTARALDRLTQITTARNL